MDEAPTSRPGTTSLTVDSPRAGMSAETQTHAAPGTTPGEPADDPSEGSDLPGRPTQRKDERLWWRPGRGRTLAIATAAICLADIAATAGVKMFGPETWLHRMLLDAGLLVLALIAVWWLVFRKLDALIHERVTAERDRLLRQAEDERDRAQRFALESRRRADELDAVFEAMVEPVVIVDAAGVFRKANKAATVQLGADLVGMSLEDRMARVGVMRPDATPVQVDALGIARALRGEHVNGERLVIKDPRRQADTTVVASASPLLANGNVVGAVASWRDITDLELAFRQIDVERAKLKSVVESITDAFLVLDSQSRIVEVNPVAEREIFGRPAGELIGKVLWEEYPVLAGSEYETRHREAMRSGKPVHFEAPSRVRPERWNELHAYPREGNLEIYVHDITERKRAEQELFEANQRLQALMKAVPVGVSFSDDPTCRHITGNPTVLAQFEARPADNISASAENSGELGRQVRYFRDGREIRGDELPLQRAVAENREIPPMELEVELPNGRRWFAETSGAPIHDTGGNVVAGVAVTVDITARKSAAAELARLASFPELNPNPIVEVDLTGALRYANPAADRLFPDLGKLGAAHPWLSGWVETVRAFREDGATIHECELAIGERWYEQKMHFVDQTQSGPHLRNRHHRAQEEGR